jgi:hypothetical protein
VIHFDAAPAPAPTTARERMQLLPDDKVCGALGVEDGWGHHHLQVGTPAPHGVRVHLAHVPATIRLLIEGHLFLLRYTVYQTKTSLLIKFLRRYQ